MGFSHRSESVSVVAQGGEGGGAALDQVVGMSVVAFVVTAGLLWIGYCTGRPCSVRFIQYLGFGGVIVGLSVYQIEFDFGVPQFRQVFQPMLIAAAAAFGLVAARIMLGRGAAIIAAVLAIGLRGGVALVVGPILGSPINWFALYLGPAIVVELIGLTPLIKRPFVFGLVSGLGVSTAGLWLESLWIGAVYHYPWPTSIWPEALAMAIPVAILTGACGALFGMVLTSQRLPSRAISIGLVVMTVLAIGGATANGLRYNVPQNVTATIALSEAPSDPGQRMVSADVRINPPDFVSDNPNWVSILAWQGKLANQRGEVVTNLEKIGQGHYLTTEPVPVWGTWKTLLRVHDGKTLTAVPIYLAADPGIGAKEVPAQANMTRPFVAEITILQRERNPDTPVVLWTIGCLVVLFCTLVLIAWPQLGRRQDQPQRSLRLQGRASANGTGMTGGPHVEILAHHGLLLAIPAFAPAIAVAGVVVYIAMRDRRRNSDATHNENSEPPRQDGSP